MTQRGPEYQPSDDSMTQERGRRKRLAEFVDQVLRLACLPSEDEEPNVTGGCYTLEDGSVYQVLHDPDRTVTAVRRTVQKLVVGEDGNRRRVTALRRYEYTEPLTQQAIDEELASLPKIDRDSPTLRKVPEAIIIAEMEKALRGESPPEYVTTYGRFEVDVQLPRRPDAFRTERLDRLIAPAARAAHLDAIGSLSPRLLYTGPYTPSEHVGLMATLDSIDPAVIHPEPLTVPYGEWLL